MATKRRSQHCCFLAREGDIIEAAQFQLKPAMLGDVQRRFAADPNTTFQMKVLTETGANFILQIPVSEIEAVRRRVYPPYPTAQ